MYKSVSPILIVSSLLLPADPLFGDTPHYDPVAGDEYIVRMTYETSTQDSNGSLGSSNGVQTIVERVIGVREGGLEIEFDLPAEVSSQARSREWQFPVRVFRPSSGPMQLLNRVELETRIELWLQEHRMTREACGTWKFTWDAFLVDCNPDSVIETLKVFDLRIGELGDGSTYEESEAAIGPGALRKIAADAERETFEVELIVNPDVVIRSRAESDVVVGQILGKPVTLETALTERAKEEVTGTIRITLYVDVLGNVWRRTRTTEIEIKLPDGTREQETSRETVERLSIAGQSGNG